MTLRTLLAFIALAPGLIVSVLAAEHTKDALDKVKQNVAKKKAVIIDVREQKEWDAGHLKDAILVPLTELNKKINDKDFVEKLKARLAAKVASDEKDGDKDAPRELQSQDPSEERPVIYCHCGAGVRALRAGDLFKKLGYDARPLKAGYKDLLQAGFEKSKQEDEKQPSSVEQKSE